MAKTKAQKNALLLDPNREKIAHQNAVLPGGPSNNNPMNVTSIADGHVTADSIYGDYRQDYAQMGAGVINPNNVKPSGLQQNFPTTPLGLNRQPYGTQQQPPQEGHNPAWEAMEGSRLASYGQAKGLPTAPMGIVGGPPIIGALPSDMPGTNGPDLYPNMVPGSTPQKIGKKGGKK